MISFFVSDLTDFNLYNKHKIFLIPIIYIYENSKTNFILHVSGLCVAF